jgi:hypothetical protein
LQREIQANLRERNAKSLPVKWQFSIRTLDENSLGYIHVHLIQLDWLPVSSHARQE